ncbi:hypothetical protein PG984_004340 [Apiospora sp. TS-2023a]
MDSQGIPLCRLIAYEMSLTVACATELGKSKVKPQGTLAMKLLSFIYKQKTAAREAEPVAKEVSSASTSTTDESYRRSLLITVPVGEVPHRYFKNTAGNTLSPQELMHLNVLVHPALAKQNISLVDALQSGLLIPKDPVTAANLVSPDSGYEPGSDRNSDERLSSNERRSSEEKCSSEAQFSSEERLASGDGPANDDDVEEEHIPISISPVKTTRAPTPVLPELDFVLGPDDFSAILDLVDQSKLVLVAEEPGIATGADMMDDLVQDETVDLDELCSILQTSPHRDSAASMDDEDQPESSLPESPTIPPAMMIQQFAEPADCPPLPGPPPSRPPPKEPMSPIKDHGHPSDSIRPLRLPHTGFVRHGRDTGSPDSPRNDYGLLGKREGDVFPSQLHLPILPPQVSASPSTPKREPLMIPMPALPPHLRVAASSPESSEIEDSQHSVDDLLEEARHQATGQQGQGKGGGYTHTTTPRPPAAVAPRNVSPRGLARRQHHPVDHASRGGCIQHATLVIVVRILDRQYVQPGLAPPAPEQLLHHELDHRLLKPPAAPAGARTDQQAATQDVRAADARPDALAFTTEVDAGEEGERLRQKTLRARREAEERERVRKEKKAAEKEKKAAEKAVEKEQKLAKKTSKGSLWGLRKE